LLVALIDHALIYESLLGRFGDLHWWPAETSDEILVGSILTQNTSWKNVEKAIEQLKDGNLISLESIADANEEDLAQRIRISGFYRQKAARLHSISMEIVHRHGSLDRMRSIDTEELIAFFGGMKGIGKETLDSILLYIFERPVMVMDSYSRRILSRVSYPEYAEDHAIQQAALSDLQCSVDALKNYHACLVELGKNYCRKTPECAECPLKHDCNYAMDLSSP